MLAFLCFNKNSKKSQNIPITSNALAPLILPTKTFMNPPSIVRIYANANQIEEIKGNPLISKYIVEIQRLLS